MLRCFLVFLSIFFIVPAQAVEISLSSSNWRPIKIMVERFSGEDNLLESDFSNIVANDLSRSGVFLAKSGVVSSHALTGKQRIEYFDDVRSRGIEYLLTGVVSSDSGDKNKVTFVLWDVITDKKLGAFRFNGFTSDVQRAVAHKISNFIYEKTAGQPGVFNTKIAYVLRHEDGVNELKIADYDGYNAQTILSSNDNIISPAWSADGDTLLYVSFERNKPIVYRQSLLTGERSVVANFKGSNSAPAMSPDNHRIAVAATFHGGIQQIYLLSENTRERLRESNGADTEPHFSPDGERLLFTSDESGAPQIYEQVLATGEVRRMSFGSRYNVEPSYTSNGKQIIFLRKDENGYNIALKDIDSNAMDVLTAMRLASSPSLSPNDAIVLFKDENKDNNLFTVSVNGKVMLPLENQEKGKIINPVWGPLSSDWF